MSLEKMHSVFVTEKQLIEDDLAEVNEILDEGYYVKKMRDTDEGIIMILLPYKRNSNEEA